MAATTQQKLKPSGFWYVIGVLLMVGGPILGGTLVGVGFYNAYQELEDFDSVPIDGGGEITLDAGDYTVYAEGPGVDTFTVFSSSDLEILDPSGEPVDLSFTTSETTYSVGSRDGTSVLTFTAPVDGTYEVNPLESVSRSSNVTDIAIGPGFGDIVGDQAGLFVIGGIVGTLGFIIGLILLIVVAVKRGKSKKQRRLAAGGYGGGYSPGGYGAPTQQPGYPPPPGAGVPPPGAGVPPPGSGWQAPPQSPIS